MIGRRKGDFVAEGFIYLAAVLTTVIVAGIFIFLFKDGLPLFGEVSLEEFFTSPYWYPTYEDAEYGIFALLIGTLSVTGLTILFSIPLAFASSIFLAVFSRKSRNFIKSIVELMAGLPSVVLGAFALKYISKWILENIPAAWTGLNIFNASLVLSLLSLPYFITLMEDAIRAVPKTQIEGSLSLGVSWTSTIFRVVIPQAKSGIFNAMILGINRIIGETMIVLMVSGGAAMIPSGIFDPVRPLTATIAGEMGETELGSTHYFALFMIGVILLLFSTFFTLIASKLKGSGKIDKR